MSSNLHLKRICEHCGNVFTARTTVTKFCSDDCAKKNYKLRQKKSAIAQSNLETKEKITKRQPVSKSGTTPLEQMELIDIKILCAITTIGERTLYRLMKEKDFPKLKIGTAIKFHKETVIKYLIDKYGNV
jgi:predicted DNA-binding transcriptional regulator AlpA